MHWTTWLQLEDRDPDRHITAFFPGIFLVITVDPEELDEELEVGECEALPPPLAIVTQGMHQVNPKIF